MEYLYTSRYCKRMVQLGLSNILVFLDGIIILTHCNLALELFFKANA